MSRKLVLKKLKASDLSFFTSYLNRYPNTKQKGFNLDKRVIEAALFPTLTAEIEATENKRAPVALTLFGPGGAGPFMLMRKVLKQHKNWRLNGEAVPSPRSEPGRFDILAPQDIAIMEFSGTSVPDAVKVVLLSATDPVDATTHAAFFRAFPSDSMSLLSEADIEKVIFTASTPAEHPIRDWVDKYILEEVGSGDTEASERLLKKRKGRGITAAELARAKAIAAKIGRLGEELLDYYFENSAEKDLVGYEWTADANAISPFDFKLTFINGFERHADAKSTGGAFESPLYLSMGELRHALNSGVPYDLYRLYNVTDSSAKMRVAKDIKGKLQHVFEVLRTLPNHVGVDALSFSPEFFKFEAREIAIEYSDETD